MSDVVNLCSKHAAHERVSYDPTWKLEALTSAIFTEAQLFCFVASCSSDTIGYTTCAPQYSTWSAAKYLYMDCLYVEAAYRGMGIGKRLMQRVAEEARELGCREIQWQTPVFNKAAVQFYDAVDGTRRLRKLRYTWRV